MPVTTRSRAHRKSSARRSYRKRVKSSTCRNKGPAACRGTKGKCTYTKGKKRHYCSKKKNTRRRRK